MRRRRGFSGLKVIGAVFIIVGFAIFVLLNEYLALGSIFVVIGLLTFTAGSVR